MPTETKTYQLKIRDRLEEYFRNLGEKPPVEKEWRPFKGEPPEKYSPRTDIAVGPFAYGAKRFREEYDRLTEVSWKFVGRIMKTFKDRAEGYDFAREVCVDRQRLNGVNWNTRCFMCMEIEKSGTRKHRLGDIINACSLGRIGVIIAWDSDVRDSFLKITEYLAFLESKDKPTYNTTNLAIVTRDQFNQCLEQ